METDRNNNRKMHICIYGGTDLNDVEAQLIKALSQRVLERMDATIVTGGFLRFKDAPEERCSTDRAALEGCKLFVQKGDSALSLRDCYEAWLPASALDRREEGGVIRMHPRKHGIAVRHMGQRSPLGRRLAMVKDVDVVVTISGEVHTNIVLEQALETNTPALPIPLAKAGKERDSEKFWRQRRGRVRDWFDMTDDQLAFMDDLTTEEVKVDIEGTATRLQEIIERAKLGTCLVLMKYVDEADELYRRVIEKTIKEIMTPERLDEKPNSKPILSNFYDAVERAHGIIADITDIKRSLPLAYEIGYLHAKGMSPLLFTRKTDAAFPVYIRELNVVPVQSDEKLAQIIRDYLERTRNSLQANMMTYRAGRAANGYLTESE